MKKYIKVILIEFYSENYIFRDESYIGRYQYQISHYRENFGELENLTI
jgi:hypothetical protein